MHTRTRNPGSCSHSAGVLIHAALPNTETMAVHISATHVLQKLIDLVSPTELTVITSTLFPAGVALTNEPKGVFAMLRCLDQLGLRCTEGPVRERAMKLADGLCGSFLESPQQASV